MLFIAVCLGMLQGRQGIYPGMSMGPKYILENGELIYKGHFDSAPSTFAGRVSLVIDGKLKKSILYNKIFCKRKHNTNEEQKDTFIAIVEKSQNLLREINNTSRFIIVFWDENNLSSYFDKRDCDIIVNKLSKKGFEYY